MPSNAEQVVTSKPWHDLEVEIANYFNLKLCDLTPRTVELLEKHLAVSAFDIATALVLVKERRSDIKRFGIAWYADANQLDYGEEWDPEEGDQQSDLDKDIKIHGIGQGFLAGYAMFFLYAEVRPTELLDYMKRRRIPHAKKVTRDVMRIYKNAVVDKA